MCGISGIGFLNGSSLLYKDHEDRSKIGTVKDVTKIELFLDELLKQNEIRGSHATGICITTSKRASILKYKVRATDFVKAEEYKKLLREALTNEGRVYSIICHTRYQTKGTYEDNNNNHPISSLSRHRGIIGVHNGCIGNDEELHNTYEKEFKELNVNRKGLVDSEIIFMLIHTFILNGCTTKEAINKTVNLLNGSMACAFVDKTNPHILWLFKDHSPTSIIINEDDGMLAFSSEQAHAKAGLILAGFVSTKYKTIVPYSADSLVGIDLHSNTIHIDKANIKKKGGISVCAV